MARNISTVLAMLAYAWPVCQACAADGCRKDADEYAHARMSLVKFDATETHLTLQFEITNECAGDIWICDDMNRGGRWHFEAVLAADGYTLIVRRRLDIPLRSFPLVGPHGLPVSRPVGTYARLKGGARRGESLSLNLPVECQRILSYPQATSSVIYVRRVLLQIGFYGGDLSAAIRSILADAERVSEDYFGDLVPVPQIGRIDTQSLWQLNNLNKMLGDATDQVVMPYAPLPLLNARLFEICVDGTRISYREATDSTELPVGIARWDPHEVLGAELVNRVAALPKCGECGCVYESPIERDHEGSTQSGSLRWCGESGAFFLGCGRRWW